MFFKIKNKIMENKKIFWAILGIAAIIALVIFFLPKENNKIGQILEIGSKSEKESKIQKFLKLGKGETKYIFFSYIYDEAGCKSCNYQHS